MYKCQVSRVKSGGTSPQRTKEDEKGQASDRTHPVLSALLRRTVPRISLFVSRTVIVQNKANRLGPGIRDRAAGNGMSDRAKQSQSQEGVARISYGDRAKQCGCGTQEPIAGTAWPVPRGSWHVGAIVQNEANSQQRYLVARISYGDCAKQSQTWGRWEGEASCGSLIVDLGRDRA